MADLREVVKGTQGEESSKELIRFCRSTFFTLQKEWRNDLNASLDSYEYYIADVYHWTNYKCLMLFIDFENGDFDDNLEMLEYFELCSDTLKRIFLIKDV